MTLLHAEYLKITRRKLYPTMLLIIVFFVAIAAFFLMVFAEIAPELAGDIPAVEKPGAYTLGAQQVAAQTWFPLILAVVMLGGELSTTAWATSLTRDPRKLIQILARILVYTIGGLLAFILGLALWSVLAYFFAEGSGSLELGEWLGLLWRMGLISLSWTSIGLGAVAVLRSMGPAIGVALAFSFLESFLALWEPYGNVSLTAATSGLFEFVLEGPGAAFLPGGELSLLHAVVIIIGWSGLGLGLTWWGLHYRDA